MFIEFVQLVYRLCYNELNYQFQMAMFIEFDGNVMIKLLTIYLTRIYRLCYVTLNY